MRFSPRLFPIAAIFAGLLAPARLSAATMPACAPGDPIVWVNTSTKVYHEQGDQYYGNTKHGEYECKSAADKAGDHLSKQTGGGKSGATSAPAGSKASPKVTPVPGSAGAAAGASGAGAAGAGGAGAGAAGAAATGAMPAASPSSKHHHQNSSASPAPGASALAAPAATPSPVASGSGKHHHKKSSASPAPGASPTASPASKKHHKGSPSPAPTAT